MPSLVLERLKLVRWDAVSELRVFSPLAMTGFAALGACATGLLAQVRVPLPFTPVPFTGQVLGVLLCGALLGARYALLSQVLYVGAGVAGVHWLAMTSGPAALTGVTGGYLVGFLLMAAVIGFCTRRFEAARTLAGQVQVMLLGVGILHTCGALHLAFFFQMGLSRAILLGAAPFLAADIMKAILAAMVTSAALRKTMR